MCDDITKIIERKQVILIGQHDENQGQIQSKLHWYNTKSQQKLSHDSKAEEETQTAHRSAPILRGIYTGILVSHLAQGQTK